MNESILNHLFLPHYLPSSANDDFLTQTSLEHEHKILERMKEYLSSLKWTDMPSKVQVFEILMDCVQHWCHLQNVQNFVISNIQSIIAQLQPGGYLPLYFHAQNAAILIEIDENDSKQALISAWQVLLPAEEIVSSVVPHISYFPTTRFRLYDRSQLSSKVHCELLMDFMYNTIEYSKSYKSSCQVNEIREVPESHYVCQWWIEHFDEINVEAESNTSIQFKKKHRDQIRWNDALLPFRRSGLWMTMKVVFQIILTKYLGHLGITIYKLLITHFLTHSIYSVRNSISADLLVHCVRKIVRRLNKIENSLVSVDSNDMNAWIQHMKQEVKMKVTQILPKANWQNLIQMNEKRRQGCSLNNLTFDDPTVYQHLCVELRAYLNSNTPNKLNHSFSGVYNHDLFANVNHADYIPSYNVLVNKMKYTPVTALTNMEIWIELCLEQWMNRPTLLINGKNCFEILLDFFENYQNEALRHYWSKNGPTDPLSYSRFILAVLTIIHVMHRTLCQDKRFKRLLLHSMHIPNVLGLFEFLILPNRDDMIRAQNLYYYFTKFNKKLYPDILEDIESKNAFGVYFANQSPTMNEDLQRIYVQAEQDKQAKLIELNNAKRKHMQLMSILNSSLCEYTNNRHKAKQCKRCKTRKQAKQIQVKIYECPLPRVRESALAVIFELQMPIEIRCYREVIWQFINRLQPQLGNKMYVWLNVPPHDNKLKPFYTGPINRKVELVSSTKSITQTHYSTPPSIGSTPAKDFFFENSLKVQISPINPIKFEDECQILTPQLDHPDYKRLQFTLSSTQFVQNQVIAQLPTYLSRLKPSQIVEFGSFRSGHRLQWWNLLTILEMDSLSLAEESVAILIIHSILQYGPLESNPNRSSNSWCPESHQQLLVDHFVDELILRLNRHLDECELNWQNELVLTVITIIAMRILTICHSTRKNEAADLAMKCRKIGENWIDLISRSIQATSPSAFDEVEKLRLKIVNVGVSCILTFSANQDSIILLLSSNRHVVSLLKAATTVRDNIILNKNESKMSTFMRNLLRFSERVLVGIQPKLGEFLQKTSYTGLNDFTVTYWAITKIKHTMNGKWQKRTKSSYDGWYDCHYESRNISIDCIRGTFLIDDMTIGFLPEKIIYNELYVRVFGDHIFEVQTGESPNTYVTKHSYHATDSVLYEFHFNDQNDTLIIKELYIQGHNVLQLIPHKCFETELPDMFVSNYSHWWNAQHQTIDFRPIQFQDIEFLHKKSYVLSLHTGYITTNDTVTNQQILLNQASAVFQSLFNQYFIRLDDKPYVYMMGENSLTTNTIIHIFLSRLGIAFQYNLSTKIIMSREYSDMYVDEYQWLGTLTGLTFGLLLSPLPGDNRKVEHYPYRKLIVPFGEVFCEKIPNDCHQTVSIQRSSTSPFLDQYFVFILNDRLKILQSTDSPTGWFYLALLHAMTSHPLPDQYTGVTGMERAFQLLHSAGCWSDQPFDALSLDLLRQIAAISPKADYYPNHLTCMIKIDWNDNGLPYSLQHFGYYLVAKRLINASQRLNFLYSSTDFAEIPELFKEQFYNESVLKKLYWDYRDFYNPLARLSVELEDSIKSTVEVKTYQPVPEYCSLAVDNTAVRLTEDLYKKGNVHLKDCSEQHWLPLSNWLNDENQLPIIWVGLLKKVVNLKTRASHNIEEMERLEKLINFLCYISPKLKIRPFYWQMLKTALKTNTVLTSLIPFPPFIEYSNIEETTFLRRRIGLSNRYSLDIRNHILTEAECCWQNSINFENTSNLATFDEICLINQLLLSWHNNRSLRSFLVSFEKIIFSTPIQQFSTRRLYYPQVFTVELIIDHYQIKIQSAKIPIDQQLLQTADEKFNRPTLGYLYRPKIFSQDTNRQTKFPTQIFPSFDSQSNPLNKITSYFKNQLQESWQKFLNDEQSPEQDSSIEEIIEYLDCLRKESRESWQALIESITGFNRELFLVGLLSRITPTTLISVFQQKLAVFTLSTSQITLLGGIIVCWTIEQHLERALHFAVHRKSEEFAKEIRHIPHSNWIPSKYPLWLILELEMNITIRNVQINVAHHMMQSNVIKNDNEVKNFVMQLNMGEGKTSIILPMLAASLSSSNSSLIRIIVLKSLFPTNYQSLRYKLGGLLNRRILPFLCRRDMNFNEEQMKQMFNRLKQGLRSCDVMLTSPEDILSFDLLTIDKCRRNEFSIGHSMITVQRWLKSFARDVLDESDEILHVKYQLVYTLGSQQSIDAGAERWNTIQLVLHLVKKYSVDISKRFDEEVCYKPPQRKSAFPEFRLQSHEPFVLLCKKIAHDWLDQRLHRSAEKKIILSFILETNSSIEHLKNKFSQHDIQNFLIFRGLLSSEVLLVALKKRHRVNYGVTSNPYFNRRMAVPFRAKDVAADRTEFGHPDVAIVLTQLAYYYSGLTDAQLLQCFDRLSENETEPAAVYEQWILAEEPNEVPANIKQWKCVNLKRLPTTNS